VTIELPADLVDQDRPWVRVADNSWTREYTHAGVSIRQTLVITKYRHGGEQRDVYTLTPTRSAPPTSDTINRPRIALFG